MPSPPPSTSPPPATTVRHCASSRSPPTGWWRVFSPRRARKFSTSPPAPAREALRTAHLAELAPHVTEKGLWLDIAVHFAEGRKP